MRALSVSVFLLAFCYSGLAAAPLPSQIDSISLERTACHGTCPVYTVTVRHDGTVTYDGKEFVKVAGRRTRKIPVEQFQKLAREVERIGFYAFKTEYSYKENADGSAEFITDMPTTFTTVQAGKLQKRVKNYYGGPDSLARLEKLIDKVTGSSAWTGVDPDET